MRFTTDGNIEVKRELSDLDRFTIDFVRILRKHTPYVIVSGYVSILLGRSRASEDVDLIVPKMVRARFAKLTDDLTKHGFYCLNTDDPKEMYEYVCDRIAVRFAKKGDVIPNMELKFAKNKFDDLALEHTIYVSLGKEELVISHLELQIAFKEEVLKSPKDIEDALHIRDVAKEHIADRLIAEYKGMLRGVR